MALRIVARRFGWQPGHSGGHQGVAAAAMVFYVVAKVLCY